MNVSNLKNGTAPIIHKRDINVGKKLTSSKITNERRNIPNRKHTVIKSRTGKITDGSRENSRSKKLNDSNGGIANTLVSTTTMNKTNHDK